jgi:branched-chain amino acid transport system substrate-binding protein
VNTMLRALCVPVVLALLVVACGQHPEVAIEAEQREQAAGGTDPDTLGDGSGVEPGDDGMAVDDPEAGGELDVPDGDQGDARQGADPGASAGDADTGEANGQQQAEGQEQDAQQHDGDGAQGAGTAEPQGQDTTGVSEDTITVATHAPVTGAAPLPSTSFEQSADLYWRWLFDEQGEDVLGRTEVDFIFADDRYEPSTARQVCRELADQAFLLYGGGGTDSIQACGQLAEQTRVPYFSPGVTEVGLDGNDWYFAASMTYAQQGPLLAEMVASRFGDALTAAVVTQTPNFDDAVAGWEEGVQQHGVNYHETLRHPRGDTSWYSQYANQLGDAGVEVVYVNTSPLDYIRFAQVAEDQGHDFQFVGVGITMGLNDVLGAGCPSVDDGIFFSPFPALETADELDPEFNQAGDQFGAPTDDIAWALWGSASALHEMFERYGETFGDELTREDFRSLVSEAGEVDGGIFPPVSYSPDDHFGGQGVHVLEADCSAEEYRDGGTFVTGF